MDSGLLVSGTWIPDYNRLRDSEFPELEVSGSKAEDFELQSKSFEDSRIPDYFTWKRYISQELNHLPVCINNLALKEYRFPKSAKPHGSH